MHLLVTIDTEEEFDWEGPFTRDKHSVDNIKAHHDHMMDFYVQNHVQPIMVLSYPVVNDGDACGLIKSSFEQNHIVIGSHLHPWVTPPFEEELSSFASYAGNLPYDLEKKKIEVLTDLIKEKFDYQPLIYCAGRYGIGANTNKILKNLGYHYDLSYFAQRSFAYDGGPDHRHIAPQIFTGEEGIIHFPMTMIYAGWGRHIPFIRKMVRDEYYKNIPVRGILQRLKICSMASLTPENTSLEEMKEITLEGIKQGTQFFQMSFHSSAFTTGAVPTIQTEDDILRIEQTIKEYILFFKDLGGTSAGFFDAMKDHQ